MAQICDSGKGFIPDSHLTIDKQASSRSFGRGIQILKTMMDDVEFFDHGRRVILKKYLLGDD